MKRFTLTAALVSSGVLAVGVLLLTRGIPPQSFSDPDANPSLHTDEQAGQSSFGTSSTQQVIELSLPTSPAPIPLHSSASSKMQLAKNRTFWVESMPIAYDEMVSFAENLKRLKEYTTLHSSDPNLPVVLTAFVDSLLAHTKGELPSIRDALEQQDGTAAYRNLLLACLVNSDAPAIDIEDLVWQAALNFSDAIEVRRTATYLLGQLERPTRRPDDLILLLSDADTDIVAFALANSRQHLDIRGYDYIKANLLDSPDINVRVAAVNVIGEAPFSDVQAVLTSILAGHTTSKDDAFSLESLPKRAAIMYLDMRDNATHELVRQIALNEEEDPGVRAKAISRFIPADNSTTTQWLLDLLQKTGSDNAVVYRAIVDALVIQPTPGIVDAINKRTNQLSDEQMKAAIFRRVKLATSRGPS